MIEIHISFKYKRKIIFLTVLFNLNHCVFYIYLIQKYYYFGSWQAEAESSRWCQGVIRKKYSVEIKLACNFFS